VLGSPIERIQRITVPARGGQQLGGTRAVSGEGFYYAPESLQPVVLQHGGKWRLESRWGCIGFKSAVTSNTWLELEVVLADGQSPAGEFRWAEMPGLDIAWCCSFGSERHPRHCHGLVTLRLLPNRRPLKCLLAISGAMEAAGEAVRSGPRRAGGVAGWDGGSWITSHSMRSTTSRHDTNTREIAAACLLID